MKILIALTEIVIFLIFECRAQMNTNSYLNVMQIIRKYGYPAESHTVQTTDGYLLEMHRIPHGRYHGTNETEVWNKKKPPIYLQHGLLGSSMDFFIIGSYNALPFLLADLGFDVWLGNVRGNKYSRAHVYLFPDEKQFWNFTWHESAIYDLPAQIDFICNHTKQDKIIYVGFSMGTTMFFAMTSTLPEYNDKIEGSFLMAAVAYVKNIRSPLLRYLAPFLERFENIAELVGSGAFMTNDLFFKIFGRIFCEMMDVEANLCMNAIFLIVGSDPREFDKHLMPTLINNYPAGYSTKAVIHYSQLVQSGKFRQFDYGEEGNMREYGRPTPPSYNLSLITTPMYIYEGKNDYLSTLGDIKQLIRQLYTLRKIRLVEYADFSHLDFLISYHVKKWVYDDVISDLTSLLNDENSVRVL